MTAATLVAAVGLPLFVAAQHLKMCGLAQHHIRFPLAMPDLSSITSWLVLAQGAAGDAPAKAADAPQPGFSLFDPWMLAPLVLIVIVYYFLLIAPDKKKRAQAADMLGNLKKNDRVETIGGICGTVANVQKDSKYVTLKIDESSNAKMKILRSAILRVVTDDEPAETSDNA